MPRPDQIDRFRRDLAALGGAERIAVAVSGGADSLALLLLADAAIPGRVEAATVDHRLRPENAQEAEFVASVCAGLGVPHATLADSEARVEGQASARALRYRLLGHWAAERDLPCLATAHHADDQAETMLMRLARGSGLAGLAGVRARRTEGALAILRPLLGWRRTELAGIVVDAGLAAVDDPSNRSGAYDRTRFRELLAGTGVLPPERLAATAAHLAQAEHALAWAAGREWQTRTRRDGAALFLDPADLPSELLRRLAAKAVAEVCGSAEWRSDKLAAVIDTVRTGGSANIAGVLVTGGPVWRFEPEPPRRSG
jgi:tRNA(Ile)-lysidine synthase